MPQKHKSDLSRNSRRARKTAARRSKRQDSQTNQISNKKRTAQMMEDSPDNLSIDEFPLETIIIKQEFQENSDTSNETKPDLPIALTNIKKEKSPSPLSCDESPCSTLDIGKSLLSAVGKYKLKKTIERLENPRLIIPRRVPDTLKDEKYWRKRKKNNESAKKARATRRMRETALIFEANRLEKENKNLQEEIEKLKEENLQLKQENFLLKEENLLLKDRSSKCLGVVSCVRDLTE